MAVNRIEPISPGVGRTRELVAAWGRWAWQTPQGWFSCENPLFRMMLSSNSKSKSRKKSKLRLPPEDQILAVDSAIAWMIRLPAYSLNVEAVLLRDLHGYSEREASQRMNLKRQKFRALYFEGIAVIAGQLPYRHEQVINSELIDH